MRSYLIISSLVLAFHLQAQQGNHSCYSALQVCGSVEQNFSITGDRPGECDLVPFYYVFNFGNSYTNSLTFSLGGASGVWEWYGPIDPTTPNYCEVVMSYGTSIEQGVFTQVNPSVSSGNSTGIYILKITPEDCEGQVNINITGNDIDLICDDSLLCTECVTSFAPQAGKYVVSAWVKEDSYNNDRTITSFDNSHIRISFQGNSTNQTFSPTGEIIDGWQRLEGILEIPQNATAITIELISDNGISYFDDIRFFPFDGSMMSYVYDPKSLRLMAELDERNYATLYEYDEEGKLIRVKKETVKGIMTIQENRDNISK